MMKLLGLLLVVGALSMPHLPPVGSPVSDPYRPPASAYGTGNRGIEYDTASGEPVRASADGIVAFSGTIGSSQYVSIDHGESSGGAGLRTTYSFLSSRVVSRGEAVRQGDVVGFAGERFHFGAKRNGVYLDPNTLFGELRTEVRLVSAN